MIYDDFARNAAREYELFLFAISGRYLSLVAPGAAASPLMVREFEAGAAQLRQTFLRSVQAAVTDFARWQTSARSDELATGFMAELGRITTQNIDSLGARLRGMARVESSAMSSFSGGMGLLLQKKLAQPEFNVTTSSGRTFKALALVRAQAREFAYRTSLNADLAKLSDHTDLAEVSYADPAHEGHGAVFSITGKTPGVPRFADIESKVFHYNATAGVRDHVLSS